jgi:hypothetical protein
VADGYKKACDIQGTDLTGLVVSETNAGYAILTEDFLWMNDDAKRMGYVGRFGYAYLSESLTLAMYGKGVDGEPFAPKSKPTEGPCQ